jgi:hypothetical protein
VLKNIKPIQIGIIREGKVPPDFRVPLTPQQCKTVETLFPNVKISVQTSPIRTFKDADYIQEGIQVVDELNHCDIIFGVKEVPMMDLIPEKTFFFFSHTLKKQPYNRALLQKILDLKIRLVDYEVIKDKNNKRLIGFGRYAGIVGCYNAFLTYGLKSGAYSLKPANQCADRKEVEQELKKVILPSNFSIVITGFGRVGHGAKEIIDLLPIKEVSPDEFLNNTFNGPVYTQLDTEDYFEKTADGSFDKQEFYSQPESYSSKLNQFLPFCDLYIPCHFWNNKSPLLITQADLQQKERRLQIVADISCDIAGPIACTIRPSKVADPVYGYDPATGQEIDFKDPNAIAVMAVDNLPCELPRDASEDFGNELIKHVLPKLFGADPDRVIERGTETDSDGKLMPNFEYLENYLKGIE